MFGCSFVHVPFIYCISPAGDMLKYKIFMKDCIEETEQQPDNGSFNNQCDKK